ncbi:MAG TPA: metallophosphoesterase [Burkholderiaceae bacterium]|nr:metallophosphoesterase [Burkholderiaceae bacterium]
MRRSFLFIFSILLHGYVGLRIVPALSDWPLAALLLASVLAASALLAPMGVFARRLRSQRLARPLLWAGLLCIGLFSSLFVLSVLRDVVLSVAALVLALAPALFSLGDVALASAVVVPLGAVLVTAFGLLNARRTAAVVAIDIPSTELPVGLEGFTIVQISDVHVGPTIRRPYVEAIVDAVNRLNADMVAVTGDLVDGSVAELREDVAPLARLRSRHGTFFVTGNHDYYSGAHAWIAELRRLGLRVLLNEHVVLEHKDGAIVVAGVTDPSSHYFDPTHRSSPRAALAGAPSDAAFRLLLAHQPRSAVAAADAGFDLQLSGHTHGGQFFPWTFVVRWLQPFATGLHRVRNLWIYTSRGTGYWGPPKRFGAPSEITLIRLVRAAGATPARVQIKHTTRPGGAEASAAAR